MQTATRAKRHSRVFLVNFTKKYLTGWSCLVYHMIIMRGRLLKC
nr:MAG TPA: hypothetical protein [Caudoviricetes sp.]